MLQACAAPQLMTPDGQLADCERSQCVSSLAHDPARSIEPISYSGSRESARLSLIRILGAMEGVKLVQQTEDYVHAEFTSRVMRSVDDLELQFPRSASIVHVRSSSRGGYLDFDANRERVESIRQQFDQIQP
ncbi:MAG TPA: DUF1499 domain-containing protein [Solimonas sp.]|nr:DUF1499 domain-containing protein [Solimonas sp.]